jgi:hypothetical protein
VRELKKKSLPDFLRVEKKSLGEMAADAAAAVEVQQPSWFSIMLSTRVSTD